MTIGASLEETVAAHPHREALVSSHQGLRYPYSELNDAVDFVARGLLARGLEVGDRIGIWSPNVAEWVIAQYAWGRSNDIPLVGNWGQRGR